MSVGRVENPNCPGVLGIEERFKLTMQNLSRCLCLLILMLCPSISSGDILTFQAGVSDHGQTTDTWLQGASGNANHDGATVIEWDGSDSGGENFLLLRFDELFGGLPGQIQPTDQITSATLTYSLINEGYSATVNEIVVDWSPPSPTTFNSFGGSPGVQPEDYGVAVGIAAGGFGFQTLNVRSSIENWAVDPSLNKGWIFRPTFGSNGVQMRSSEATQLSERPMLTVVINEGEPPPAVVLRGPYLQRVTPESVTIMWRTDVPTISRVRYGDAPGALTQMVTGATAVTDHEITLTGLAANSSYFYSVGNLDVDLEGNTLDHFFFTAHTTGSDAPFRVWAIGDFGTGSEDQLTVRDSYHSFTGSTYTDLWLCLGDNAYQSGTEEQYQSSFFNVYKDLLIQTPFSSTRGNHETDAAVYYGIVSNPSDGQSGGVVSGTEAYFSFDYANVHFICLDSEGSDLSTTGPMLSWLELDLASTMQQWVVAFFHHPPYTKGTHDSDDPVDSDGKLWAMRENAIPILEAGGCDLVLAGHSHVYERSFLIDGHTGTSGTWNPSIHQLDGESGDPAGTGAYQKVELPNQGTVYVVMGSSAQAGSGTLDHPAMYYSGSVMGSLVLDFSGSELVAKMIRIDGIIEDAFSISKSPAIDCNDNGIPDAEDLASGTDTDCDENGTLDSCDLASGAIDSDSDGVLDACQGVPFVRGDVNQDGSVDIADVIYSLGYLFGGLTLSCHDAADTNDDGTVDIADPISLLGFLFNGDAPPGPPYPRCAPAGLLSQCAEFLGCP